jgi:cytoskeletal protein CcmA (bactofilin family)
MTRRVSGAALVALVLATITGCGVHYDGDDAVSHEFGSDYFGAGGMLSLTDAVEGDALLAGGRVDIASEVKGDLVVAGGELSIGGAVGDDLYAGGGNVQLDAIVAGNARVAGGDVAVGPATVVAGALSLTGGRVQFDGNVHQYLQASGGSVRLNGEVHGDAEVNAEELEIGPDTRIGGRLVYRGPAEPVVPEGAQIAGGVEFHEENVGRYFEDVEPRVRDTVHGVGTFLWFSGVFVAAALFLLVLPDFASEAGSAVGRRPMQSLGLGLAVLVCVPFVAVLLLITIIGIPLALLLMSLYLLVLFLGWVTTALFVAQRGLDVLRPRRPPTRGWQLLALFLALVALWLLTQIPLVGGLVGFIALMAGIGALTWRAWHGRKAATA